MSQPKPLTIAEINQLPVGSPVPLVVGTLVSIFDYKTNVGRNDSTIQSAMLKDETGDEIRINIWNQRDYKDRKGANVRIVGVFEKGKCSTHIIENKHFNPPAIELQLSKSSVILISGTDVPAPAVKQTPQEPKEAAPSGEQTDGAATPPPAKTDGAVPPPPSRGPRPVNGQTVGNAMKLAVDVVLKAFEESSEAAANLNEYLAIPEFSIKVHQVASDLIRIAQRLERGYLAPTVRERYKAMMEELSGEPPPPPEEPAQPPPQPKSPSTKPKPGPDGSAFTPGGSNEDEDVPF